LDRRPLREVPPIPALRVLHEIAEMIGELALERGLDQPLGHLGEGSSARRLWAVGRSACPELGRIGRSRMRRQAGRRPSAAAPAPSRSRCVLPRAACATRNSDHPVRSGRWISAPARREQVRDLDPRCDGAPGVVTVRTSPTA
jgi:hypothetical protein